MARGHGEFEFRRLPRLVGVEARLHGDRGKLMSKRFIGARQTTLARNVELSGTGVHSGAPVSVVLHPAESDVGFRFLVSRRGRIV